MKYQNDYYTAIQNCNICGESTEFIEFMLRMIDEVLDRLIEGITKQIKHVSVYTKKLLDVMDTGIAHTTRELMELLKMKSKVSFIDNYLSPAIDNGLVKMTYPDTSTSKNQTYYKD